MSSSDGRVYRTSPGRLAVLALFLVLLFIGQELVRLPGTLLGATLQNALHIPAYAGLTLLLALCFPRFRGFHLVGASLVVGVGFEVLQSYTGRDADFFDVARNLVGTGIALMMVRGAGAWPLRWIGGGVVLLILTFCQPLWVWLAYQHRDGIFPQLLDANDPRQGPLLYSNSPLEWIATPPDLEPAVDRSPAPGARALRVCFADVDYPGIHLNEVVADWRAYRWLNVRLLNPGERAIVLTAAVNHRGSPGTSAYQYREFVPGWHHWRVPLEALAVTAKGRTAGVGKLILHGDRSLAGACLVIERVWLDG